MTFRTGEGLLLKKILKTIFVLSLLWITSGCSRIIPIKTVDGYSMTSKDEFIPINQSDIVFYSDFKKNIKDNSSSYLWTTASIKKKYSKGNQSFYSIYDHNNQWLGYVDGKDIDKFSLKYSGHRGFAINLPENSIASINNAVKNGFKAIEIDPRVTKDGVPVLMHDPEINRTTNGSGLISQIEYKDIENLHLKLDNKITNEKVPTLDEIMKIAKANNLMVNIDCSKMDWGKKSNYDPVMKVITDNNMINNCFFVLTNASQKNTFNKAYPDARLSWLYYEEYSDDKLILDSYSKYKNVIFSVPEKDVQKEQKVIREFLNRGIQIHVYSVENKDKIDALKKYDVSYVETNTVKP